MFCIVCGKNAEIDNFCKKHYMERIKLFEIKDFSIYACQDCGKGEPDDDYIKKQIKWNFKAKEVDIHKKIVGNRIIATITATGKIGHGLEKKEKRYVKITMHKRKCDLCIKKSGGYFESVFQIRGKDKDEILGIIEKLSNTDDISSINLVKPGYDVKFISKKKAATLAKTLKRNFSVTGSYKLIGQKKDKKLYRSFYAVR